MLAVRPHLVDIVTARDVIPALAEGTFLHAGPPIAWDDCSGPLRGALIGAMLYEGLRRRCRASGGSWARR